MAIQLSFNMNASSEPFAQKMHDYLKLIEEVKKFNGEVLIVKDNEVLFNQSVGWSSIAWSIKNKNNNKYNIASITKSFTSVLILKAVEEGLLNIGDFVSDYLPQFDEKFNKVTINHLLRHQSGIPHYEGVQGYWSKQSKIMMDNKQVIAMINNVQLEFEPGKSEKYSSLGYYLLGCVLENVYRQSYSELLKNKILEPLNLKDSGSVNTLQIIKNLNEPYHIVSDEILVRAPHRNYSSVKASGDIYSTSLDLLKWHHSLFNNLIINKESTRLLFSAEKNGEFAMGWYVTSKPPVKYYHGGGTWGYSAYNVMYPNDNISLIILANTSSLAIQEIAESIEKIIFNKTKSKVLTSKAEKFINADLDIEGAFKSTTSTRILVINKNKNKWHAQLEGNPPFQIYLRSSNQFYGKKVDVNLTFNIANDNVQSVSVERLGQQFEFKKVQ